MLLKEKIKAWIVRLRQEGSLDIRYFILWFMVTVYPFVIIPHPYMVTFAAGHIVPTYYEGPRLIVLVLLSIIALIVLLKDKIPLNHPVIIPLVFFIIFSMISSFLAPVPITAWIGSPIRFTGVIAYYSCIVLFLLAQTTRKTEKLLFYMVAAAAVVSVLALFQYFDLNFVPGPKRPEIISPGTMGHPNFLGTYTAFILPGAVLLYLKSGKKHIFLFTCLIYTGLLVSLCRGTWLASFIGFLVIAYYAWKKKERRKLFLLLCAAFLVITLILMPMRDGALLARFVSVSSELGKGVMFGEEAGTYRIFIWKRAFHIFLKFWPFGIGADHLIYAGMKTPAGELVDKAHNIYLEMAVTMGIFTLFSYLAFLSFFFRKCQNEITFLLFTMVLVYLLQGITNIDVIMIMPLFWITLGLLHLEQEKERRPLKQPDNNTGSQKALPD